MWQRLTERANRVLVFAQEEAVRLGEDPVGTAHLLLGLIRERDSVSARLLARLGVSLDRIQAELVRIRGGADPVEERRQQRSEPTLDAVVTEYLDKNLGGIFIVWDRMFGTFAEERRPPTYGLVGALRNGPLDVAFGKWRELWKAAREPGTWAQRCKRLLVHPRP